MAVEEELSRSQVENERLGQELATARQELAAARQVIAVLEQQVTELEQGSEDHPPPPFVKANRPKPGVERKPRKKRASHHNHARRGEAPTRTVEHGFDRCPDCNYHLRGQSLDYSRQVIELPPPQPVEITEHRVIKRYCPHCERFKIPPLELNGQVLGQGRLGVRLASLVSYLRITLRLPIRLIQSYLETLHRLKVSVGEIVYLPDQVRKKTKGSVEGLREEALKSGVLHADETGWREDGQTGYIWSFATHGGPDGKEAIRYYERDQHRSQSVVRRVLGNRFKGVLVSDFYVAYNDYECKKQRCWSHLLRDLHELKEKHQGEKADDTEAVKWAQAVRALYDQAESFLASEATPSQEGREQKYVSLVERAHGLGLEYARAKEHPANTLCKRVLLHEDELFQFVLVAGLSPNNNLAERSIRPLVVIRKISGGSRSDSGSKTTMALASLLETWRVRGLNPFQECLRLLSQNPAPSPA